MLSSESSTLSDDVREKYHERLGHYFNRYGQSWLDVVLNSAVENSYDITGEESLDFVRGVFRSIDKKHWSGHTVERNLGAIMQIVNGLKGSEEERKEQVLEAISYTLQGTTFGHLPGRVIENLSGECLMSHEQSETAFDLIAKVHSIYQSVPESYRVRFVHIKKDEDGTSVHRSWFDPQRSYKTGVQIALRSDSLGDYFVNAILEEQDGIDAQLIALGGLGEIGEVDGTLPGNTPEYREKAIAVLDNYNAILDSLSESEKARFLDGMKSLRFSAWYTKDDDPQRQHVIDSLSKGTSIGADVQSISWYNHLSDGEMPDLRTIRALPTPSSDESVTSLALLNPESIERFQGSSFGRAILSYHHELKQEGREKELAQSFADLELRSVGDAALFTGDLAKLMLTYFGVPAGETFEYNILSTFESFGEPTVVTNILQIASMFGGGPIPTLAYDPKNKAIMINECSGDGFDIMGLAEEMAHMVRDQHGGGTDDVVQEFFGHLGKRIACRFLGIEDHIVKPSDFGEGAASIRDSIFSCESIKGVLDLGYHHSLDDLYVHVFGYIAASNVDLNELPEELIRMGDEEVLKEFIIPYGPTSMWFLDVTNDVRKHTKWRHKLNEEHGLEMDLDPIELMPFLRIVKQLDEVQPGYAGRRLKKLIKKASMLREK